MMQLVPDRGSRYVEAKHRAAVSHPSPDFMQPHLTSGTKEVCDSLFQKGLCFSNNNFKLKMYMSGETRVRQNEKDLKANHFDPRFCFSQVNTFEVYGVGVYDQVTGN